jgi:hypothetical protein
VPSRYPCDRCLNRYGSSAVMPGALSPLQLDDSILAHQHGSVTSIALYMDNVTLPLTNGPPSHRKPASRRAWLDACLYPESGSGFPGISPVLCLSSAVRFIRMAWRLAKIAAMSWVFAWWSARLSVMSHLCRDSR